MTSKQRIYLMADLWPQACAAQGWDPKDDDRRHEFYADVLGVSKRFRDFTQADFGRVKSALLVLIGRSRLEDGLQLAAAHHSADHPEPEPTTINPDAERRVRWVILNRLVPALGEHVQYPIAYVERIMLAQFGTSDLAKLENKELWNLLYTLTARLKAMASSEKLGAMVAAREVFRARAAAPLQTRCTEPAEPAGRGAAPELQTARSHQVECPF